MSGKTPTSYRVELSQPLQGFLRKLLIHGLVGQPEGLVEDGPVRHAVEQRPQRRVAAPVVVELVVVGAEVDGHHLVAAQLGGLPAHLPRLGFGDFVLGGDSRARPAQPGSYTQSEFTSGPEFLYF